VVGGEKKKTKTFLLIDGEKLERRRKIALARLRKIKEPLFRLKKTVARPVVGKDRKGTGG